MKVLVAGASGFFAQTLIPALMADGHYVIALDLDEPVLGDHSIICDATNSWDLERKTNGIEIDAIINLAAQIDFASKSGTKLYRNNVESNNNLVSLAISKRVKSFVFTSSNSIFLGSKKSVISPADTPQAIDPYGKSKVTCELEIQRRLDTIPYQIIRCPNILASGRKGMMSILFDLMSAGAALWVVGKGEIKHQTLFAPDLADYIRRTLSLPTSHCVNLGSEDVPTMRVMFETLCTRTGSSSRIRTIPKLVALPAMMISFWLRVSPLGPYQQRMLTRSFEFMQEWGYLPIKWSPTKSNTDMIQEAYETYLLDDSHSKSTSANQRRIDSLLVRILRRIR
jgi:nucleoside-diphosphate-sugar epimerase